MFYLRISRLFAKRPRQSLELTVRRHWDECPENRKSVLHLRDFEESMWRLNLRLGQTPLEHHIDMMRLLRNDLEPKLRYQPCAGNAKRLAQQRKRRVDPS